MALLQRSYEVFHSELLNEILLSDPPHEIQLWSDTAWHSRTTKGLLSSDSSGGTMLGIFSGHILVNTLQRWQRFQSNCKVRCVLLLPGRVFVPLAASVSIKTPDGINILCCRRQNADHPSLSCSSCACLCMKLVITWCLNLARRRWRSAAVSLTWCGVCRAAVLWTFFYFSPFLQKYIPKQSRKILMSVTDEGSEFNLMDNRNRQTLHQWHSGCWRVKARTSCPWVWVGDWRSD